MMNAKEVLKKAIEMDEYNQDLPEVEVGQECKLGDVWDGRGNVPEDSYSYPLNDNDWIDYAFEIIEKNDDDLETIIKITDISFL